MTWSPICRQLSNGTVIVVSGAGGTMIVNRTGRCVYGTPQRNAEQATTAVGLGYGEDVVTMVADHDPLHALLTDWLGLPESVALFGGDAEVAAAEEAAVLAVQKLMRLAGGRMPYPSERKPR